MPLRRSARQSLDSVSPFPLCFHPNSSERSFSLSYSRALCLWDSEKPSYSGERPKNLNRRLGNREHLGNLFGQCLMNSEVVSEIAKGRVKPATGATVSGLGCVRNVSGSSSPPNVTIPSHTYSGNLTFRLRTRIRLRVSPSARRSPAGRLGAWLPHVASEA